MKSEVKRAIWAGVMVAGGLSILVIIGSRNLQNFDAALVAYTFASIFALFGITYRYAIWLQRPPTSLYWRRGRELFWQKGHRLRNIRFLAGDFFNHFVRQGFIDKRSHLRWMMHSLIFWGVNLAFAVTFPLVFGWIHFESAGDQMFYRAFVFGFPTFRFAVDGIVAWLFFHALDISAVVVIVGVGFAFARRLKDKGAMSVQQLANDGVPLILLFAIAMTGLMLTVSAAYLKGYSFSFIAISHAVSVILFLLYLPFGKFFHLFQRPAQMGVALYKRDGKAGEQARCARCGDEYASAMHVADLKQVQAALGVDYRLADDGHYQDICPACRRKSIALSQLRLQGR